MRIVITILLVLFLPLAALMVVLSEPVCYALVSGALDNYTTNSTEHDFLVGVAMAVRDFSLGNDAAALPVGDDYRTAITSDALMHLLDVRVVFVLSELVFVLVFILLLVIIFLSVRRNGAAYVWRPLLIGGAVPLIAAVVLGIAIALDFNAFFTWMHGLFFADGSWTFPAESLLIRSLPFEFWIACAVVWALSTAVLCLLSILIGTVLRKRSVYTEKVSPK